MKMENDLVRRMIKKTLVLINGILRLGNTNEVIDLTFGHRRFCIGDMIVQQIEEFYLVDGIIINRLNIQFSCIGLHHLHDLSLRKSLRHDQNHHGQ